MKASTRSRMIEAARAWADEIARELEGIAAREWPDAWDPHWAGALPLADDKLDHAELDELVQLANHEAAVHWSDLVAASRVAGR